MSGEGLLFPQGFLWGVAASAYQVEGGAGEGGRARSIWDTFAHTSGKIRDGHTGDTACDHYHRYPEDVTLMRELGVGAYRLSLAWPRVLPSAVGELNQEGLDFYRRLLDALLGADIEPWVCLYHWDLPQALQERGGWANPGSVRWFAEYAGAVGQALGDKVRTWILLNEPRCIAWLGHLTGEHAPGLRDPEVAFRVSRHLLLAQGAAAQALRTVCPRARVGTVLDLNAVHSVTTSPDDVAAAARWDELWNRWFLDPLLKGELPPLAARVGVRFDATEWAIVRTPLDFLGVNYYTRALLAHDPAVPLIGAKGVGKGTPVTEMGWEIYPRGLYEVLVRLKDEYGNPAVYITENGAAFPDIVVHDGVVQDDDRIAYLRAHILAVRKAVLDGCRVRGYFVWSILDNFEWAWGYTRRFGLVHVDFTTLRRTPKRSYFWYREVVARNGLQDLL